MRRCHMGLDQELEVPVTQLMVPGTEGGLPAEHRLLGRTGDYLSHNFWVFFLRYGAPDHAKGGRKDCVCLWVF